VSSKIEVRNHQTQEIKHFSQSESQCYLVFVAHRLFRSAQSQIQIRLSFLTFPLPFAPHVCAIVAAA
jgi:hypothetical protein